MDGADRDAASRKPGALQTERGTLGAILSECR